MNKFTYWFLSFILVAGFSSCSDKEGIETKIPKKASGVMMVNTSSIAQKVLLDKLGELFNLEDLGFEDGTTDDEMPLTDDQKWLDLLKNPGDVGVDILADIFIYTDGGFKNGTPNQVTLLFKLSDPKDLEEYMADNPPSGLKGTTQDGGKFKYRNLQKSTAIGWNGNTLAFIFSNPSLGKKDFKDDFNALFNRKKSESLASDERFQELLEADPDLGFSVNMEKVEMGLAEKVPSSLFQGQWTKYVNTFIDFDDGEIKVRSTQYIKEDKEEAYASITDGVMMEEMFDHFNIDQSLGFVNFRFDPASIRDIVDKDESTKRNLNSFLAGIQMSEDEFFGMFTGGAMFSITGVEMVEVEEKSYELDDEFNMTEIVKTVEKPQPQFLASLGIKNGNKFLDGISRAQMAIQEGDKYKINPLMTSGMNVYAWTADDKVIISSKSSLDGASNSGEIYDFATSNPMSAYMNADAIIDVIPEDEQKQFKPIFEDAKNTFKGMEMFVEPSNGEKVSTDFTLKFDEDNNGLVILLDFISRMRKKQDQLTM